MSDLREAIAAIVASTLTGDGEAPGPPLIEDYALADALLPVFEAYLRERIEAQTRYGFAYDHAHPWQDMIGPVEGGRFLNRTAVLEALGGSDE